MKRFFRSTLCAALTAAALLVPASAAQKDALPEKQGDFYVLVNGSYVTFPDAVPQIRNERSCLPFVAVFNQLGFDEKDMTWNADSNTATASKGDLTIALTIGKNEIVLTRAGQTTTIPTDVAPYIDPATNRTYVPFGLVADALGYNVGWDASLGAVILDDVDAVLAANTASYSHMERLMEYSRRFNEKNCKVSGQYALDMSIKDSDDSANAKVNGKYDMITKDNAAFQFNTDMKLDLTASENLKADLDDLLKESNIKLPLTVDLDMRGDLGKGTFYFQSAALANLMQQPGMANAWYKLDMNPFYEQAGLNSTKLLQLINDSKSVTFQDALKLALQMFQPTSADYTSADYLASLNTIFADSAFTKSGSDYVSTTDLEGVNLIFTLYDNGGKVNGYAMQVSYADPAAGGMEMNVSMRGSKLEMKMGMDLTFDPSNGLSLSMTMDGDYQTTDTVPVTEPPAGDVVIDFGASLLDTQP